MLGKTNACVGGSSSGSGDVIKAVNKTGAVINEGDKVWLTRRAQVATSEYMVTDKASLSSTSVLSRTGTFVATGNMGFSVTADGAVKASDFSFSNYKGIMYMDNNSVFASSGNDNARVDETQYNLIYQIPIAKDIFVDSRSYERYWRKNDVSTGTTLSYWTNSFISESYWKPYSQAMVNGKIYQLINDYSYRIKTTLNDDFTTTGVRYTYENGGWEYPAGTTSDNKYIICSTSEDKSDAYLRLVEVINEDHLRCLPQSEMPEDLQEFYSITKCSIVFNPYTGILTIATGKSCVIMKYENGVWTKLPIDLGLGDKTLYKFVTVSDDLTRAGYNTPIEGSANYKSYIANIANISGYTALPYKFYNINKDTITGKATGSANIDETFELSTVLPDKVDVTITCETDNIELSVE